MAPKFINTTFKFVPVRVIDYSDKAELRRRSLGLYRAWYRQLPVTVFDYQLKMDGATARSKLREIFVRNSKIEDPKLINNLIMRGEMELNETVNRQKEECHLMKYFRTQETKPKSFLTKFLEGN